MPDKNVPSLKFSTRAKNFVVNHKTALSHLTTAAITATLVFKLQNGALNNAHEFIAEHGLTQEWISSHPIIVK